MINKNLKKIILVSAFLLSLCFAGITYYPNNVLPQVGVDINGGAIDGTIIGGASAVAGSFTTGAITTLDVESITFPVAGADTAVVTPDKQVTVNVNGTDYLLLLRSI